MLWGTVTGEETKLPVVGQNTLGDTKIKVVKYEDVRGCMENAIESINFLGKKNQGVYEFWIWTYIWNILSYVYFLFNVTALHPELHQNLNLN